MLFETFVRKVEGQGPLDGQKMKRSQIQLVRMKTCTFMHGFENNLAQLLSLRCRSAI